MKVLKTFFFSVRDTDFCYIFSIFFFVFKQAVRYQISNSDRLFQHMEDHSKPRAVMAPPRQPHPPAGDVLHAGNPDPHLATGTPCKDKKVFVILPAK